MTTNTEHRRRETDKVDQICIKYQLEKANARIAELEAVIVRARDELVCVITYCKEENWESDYIEELQETVNSIDLALPPSEKQGE